MINTTYKETLKAMTNEQLLDIYFNKRNEYAEEVHGEIGALLKHRQVNFKQVTHHLSFDEVYKHRYIPLLFGLSSIILNISIITRDDFMANPGAALFITIFIRLIFLAYTDNYCKERNLNHRFWLVIVLLLGGLGLVGMSFASSRKR